MMKTLSKKIHLKVPRLDYWFDPKTSQMGFHDKKMQGPLCAVVYFAYWQRRNEPGLELLMAATFFGN
jgi:hypothetical protein